MTDSVHQYSLLSEEDIIAFNNGTHYRLYEKLGSHLTQGGIYFAVWAPNALSVSVIGNFNGWNKQSHVLYKHGADSGIWEGVIEGINAGELYKYHIISNTGISMDKGDPFAHYWETRPATASVTWDLHYQWGDQQWMQDRKKNNSPDAPWSVYEVNLLSWMRPDKHNEKSVNTYVQAIELLVPYVKEMGFTHVEMMPVMEYPNDASWGYQGTGFFAPTSRFGTPLDFMKLIETFHRSGIGVILDWVPSHFPYDAHGLYMFDGTHAYENADMRRGYHPDWNSYIFDYGKGPVKSFLTSSASFWLDKFHADGLRVDGVSSLLILSYSRGKDQWQPNEKGEDRNLEAIRFLQDLNDFVKKDFPDVQVIAEESTAWKGVTAATVEGGLGFGMKWMMGWMHDSLEYFTLDPSQRPEQRDRLKLSMKYYYDEKFMLAYSHDEVVYGKKPMLYKMPGDDRQRFSNLRLLYTYMFTHPGGKLIFMGDEFGSTQEWDFKTELPWELLQYEPHRLLKDCVRDLCLLLRSEPALFENQFDVAGFEWIRTGKKNACVFIYRRKGRLPENDLVIVLNTGIESKRDCKIKADGKKTWKLVFSSNDKKYGGTSKPIHGSFNGNEIIIDLPGLSALILK